MSSVKLDATVDLNKFYEAAREDIGSLIQGAGVNQAIIFNNSGATVNFEVFNYIDSVNWVPAQQTKIADGYYGAVAASGSFFKIHPNGVRDDEFLVAPNKAYVFHGPGKVEVIK